MKKFTVISIALAMLMASATSFVMADETTPVVPAEEIVETTEPNAGNIDDTAEVEDADGAKSAKTANDKKEKPDKVKEEKPEKVKDDIDEENDNKDEIDDGNDDADDKDNIDDDKDNVDDEAEKAEKRKVSKELLEQKKAERKQAKLEIAAYIDEIKAIFKDSDVETRKEILAEIAEAKRALRDYSIGTFIKGIAVDFDKYDGVKPMIENNRTLTPLRAVSEAYGAEVVWEEETQTITITKDIIKIAMQIGSETAYVNEQEVQLDVAPKIIKNRTLVPIRFISETFNLNVEWDEESQTVVID